MNKSFKYVNERNKKWDQKVNKNTTIARKLHLCAPFFVFLLQSLFCDDLVTFTNSLLIFLLSVQIPCVSCWFWQTIFWLESKNLVCQNQPETQGACIDSGKKARICTSLKIITKVCWRAKIRKNTQRWTLSFKSWGLGHIVISFFLLPFTFLILLLIFQPLFVLFCAKHKEAETVADKWTIGLKMWTVERKMK